MKKKMLMFSNKYPIKKLWFTLNKTRTDPTPLIIKILIDPTRFGLDRSKGKTVILITSLKSFPPLADVLHC